MLGSLNKPTIAVIYGAADIDHILCTAREHTIIVCSYMIGHLSWELKDLPTLLAQHMFVYALL